MKVTETFGPSIQGEAKNTGMLCTWLRTWSCNLQCKGFSQVDPSNKDTWVPQFPVSFDPKKITRIEDIPLPVVGCDSAFSHSAKFKHLYPDHIPAYWAEKVIQLLPDKKFRHVGHVFTGGEPMLYQQDLRKVFDYWHKRNDIPNWIGIETNGTIELEPDQLTLIRSVYDVLDKDFYFSISPKLLHVSGESEKKAHKPKIAAQYIEFLPASYLKFVVNTNPACWEQVNRYVAEVEDILGYEVEKWVMPVGATIEQQESDYVPVIADMAIARGYHVSLRNHVIIWGNDQVGR